MGGKGEPEQGCRAGHFGCVRGFLGLSEVASAAAHFEQGDPAGRMTRRGGRGLSYCLRTANGRCRHGYGHPGGAGLQNSGSWSG